MRLTHIIALTSTDLTADGLHECTGQQPDTITCVLVVGHWFCFQNRLSETKIDNRSCIGFGGGEGIVVGF